MGTLTGSALWGGGAGLPASGTPVSRLAYTALRLAGVLWAPGRGPSASELGEIVEILNSLMDSLNTKRGNIFTVASTKWPTQASRQSYTIGKDPTGNSIADWDGARPQRIERANLLLPTSPTVRRPLKIWNDKEWAAIRLQEVYTYPEGLYNDGAYPLSTIYFKPIPDGAYQIELFTWQALGGFVSLEDSVVFPPGYQRMLEYNLAVELIPRYPVQSKLTPIQQQLVIATAAKSKADVQGMNTASPKIGTADVGTGRTRGGFNWASGEAA